MLIFTKKNKYLILFLLMVVIITIIATSEFNIHFKKSQNQAFKQKLSSKEQIAYASIDSILTHVEKNNLNGFINKNAVRFDYLSKEQGIDFLVYDNANLVFWTSNSLTLPTDTSWVNNVFDKIGNFHVEIITKKVKPFTIVCLIDIMESYPYENKFLINGFHKTFKLDNDYSLLLADTKSEDTVFNAKGEYLFSLIRDNSNSAQLKNNILLFLFIVAFVFLLLFGRDRFRQRTFSFRQFFTFSFVLVTLRFLVQYFKYPSFLYSFKIFQPQYFAYSNLFSSLGELLITVVLVSYLIFLFYTKVELKNISDNKKPLKTSIPLLWLAIVILYSLLAQNILKHLITDSSFQFEAYDVLNLSVFSFVGYFLLLVLFIGVILLVDKACLHIKGVVSFKNILKAILLVSAIGILLSIYEKNYQYILPILLYSSIISYWVYIRLLQSTRFGMVVVLIAMFSAFCTYFIRKENFAKRIETSKVIAVSIAREQDPVTEVILSEAIKNMPNDSIVKQYLGSEFFNYDAMIDYVKKKYFAGYLQRYNMQLTICNKHDSVLLDEHQQLWQHCYGFFENLLQNDGVETSIPNLYFIKDPSGGLNYFLTVEVELFNGWDNVTLFIELLSRPNIKVLGYPELLLEKSFVKNEINSEMSTAKYENNQLIARTGEFPYALDRSVYEGYNSEFQFFQMEGYDHLLYNSRNNHTVLISYPTVRFYNIIISFTYIFFFLLIQTTILLVIGNRFSPIIDFHYSIKNRIVFSMVLILLISLFFVGGGTIMYTYNRFEKTQMDILSEKIQSVLVELEHKLSDYDNIYDISPEYLNGLLVKFSNVFYSDINLYDIDGKLVGTSRAEIFDRNLTGKRINAKAYRALVINKKARVVHKEHIGKMDYYSAYVPFINGRNQMLAYINLPYFTKELELRQELLRVVVAVINIYTFLFVLSILVAVYISSRLTEPLRVVQQRIKNIKLSKNNEQIEYSGQDEIAELVTEYNRMLGELDKSAKLLARSERESAWREMARQIAHEIKNPLTPMKLSIQLLDKSLKNNDADFAERFDRSAKTLIEQIDSLSAIASTFSQFSVMSKSNAEKVDIIDRLNQSAELFNESTDVVLKTNFDASESIYVLADNDKALQVFNNLMKNALQSIPHNKKGEVELLVSKSSESVVVEIHDNGIGISPEMEDKLFQPNFTTKTSGMGLGLAIVKNIVEEFGGAIWYKSELGKGAAFFVSFPIYTENE